MMLAEKFRERHRRAIEQWTNPATQPNPFSPENAEFRRVMIKRLGWNTLAHALEAGHDVVIAGHALVGLVPGIDRDATYRLTADNRLIEVPRTNVRGS